MVSIILRYNDLFKYDSPTELRSWKTRTGFIHSFIQYLLSTMYLKYHILCYMLERKDDKIDTVPSLIELTLYWERQIKRY